MNELTRAAKWIHGKLVADSALNTAVAGRIYADLAPPEATWPFVVFQHQGSADVVAAAGLNRIMVSSVWVVKAVTRAESWEALRTLADRIDIALQEAAGTAEDGTVLSCAREAPISFVEADNNETPGVQWRHLGAQFRLEIQVP